MCLTRNSRPHKLQPQKLKWNSCRRISLDWLHQTEACSAHSSFLWGLAWWRSGCGGLTVLWWEAEVFCSSSRWPWATVVFPFSVFSSSMERLSPVTNQDLISSWRTEKNKVALFHFCQAALNFTWFTLWKQPNSLTLTSIRSSTVEFLTNKPQPGLSEDKDTTANSVLLSTLQSYEIEHVHGGKALEA